MKEWLKNAIFYEIYPNSFYDSNGDGYGDFKGIIEKLDYVKSLNVNAIWLNPHFESMFRDGGYDVVDYFKCSPRFGTEEDFDEMLREIHKRDMKLIIDLVPGHTSDKNEMFIKSASPIKNELSNRYIWTNNPWNAPYNYRFMVGMNDRFGAYMVNFFCSQPALNYGFYNVTADWQLHYTHPDCIATRDWLITVMEFWLNRGVDGFRVDMADSLVKDDWDKVATMEVWKYITEKIRNKFPNCILVSEWCCPERALKCGFDCDFMLDHENNFYNNLVRAENNYDPKSNKPKRVSVFNRTGETNFHNILGQYLYWLENTHNDGYLGFITCNHDTPRPTKNCDINELKLFYTMVFTCPGIPFLYYGDEIGMKYLENISSVESGYQRTGSRTPMQWDNSKNLGFSTSDEIFLPVDTSSDAPTVASQENKPSSILNTVRKLTKLRLENEDLQGNNFEMLTNQSTKNYFAYKRGKFIIVINPTLKACETYLNLYGDTVFHVNGTIEGNFIPPLSANIIRIKS